MILKFNNYIYETEIKSCPCGNGTGLRKSLAVKDDGTEYLICEEFDLQALIQSYADDCSIERIIVAHGLGDDLLLNQQSGAYLDEEAVKEIKQSKTLAQNDLNVTLYSLYSKGNIDMSYDDFAKAVTSGNISAIKYKEETKE